MVDTEWNGRDTERCKDRQKTDSAMMHHQASRSLECALHTEREMPATRREYGCHLADARLHSLHRWMLPLASAAHHLAELSRDLARHLRARWPRASAFRSIS